MKVKVYIALSIIVFGDPIKNAHFPHCVYHVKLLFIIHTNCFYASMTLCTSAAF